jgi:hypothetical protein
MDRREATGAGVGRGPDPAGDAAEARTLWILWSGMLSSVLLYALVGFFLRPGGSAGTGGSPPALVNVIAAGAVFLAATSIGLRGMLARSTSYRSYSIVRWALAEAIGVAGLVLSLLGARFNVFAAFIGVAILLLLVHRPSPSVRSEYEQLRGEGQAGVS